jgi:hypothetical protein
MLTKDLSEDHQALYLRSHIAEMWRYNRVCRGMVVWCYNDYMTPRRLPKSSTGTAGMNTMGLVTRERENKAAYRTVQEMYRMIADAIGDQPGYAGGPP